MNNKIFLSPERRPAPHGKYAVKSDIYEHDVCNEYAEILKPILEHNGFNVYIAPKPWTMAQRVKYANDNRFNYYMAIHTNAGGGTGTECLYYNHPDSERANQLVYNELVKLYPSKRGIKDYSNFYENNQTNMVSCYPEIAFHDNPKDAQFLLNNKPAIAEALAKGICAYYGVAYKPLSEGELYGVVKQVIALTGKEKAQEYANELNKDAGDDAYYKVIDIK